MPISYEWAGDKFSSEVIQRISGVVHSISGLNHKMEGQDQSGKISLNNPVNGAASMSYPKHYPSPEGRHDQSKIIGYPTTFTKESSSLENFLIEYKVYHNYQKSSQTDPETGNAATSYPSGSQVDYRDIGGRLRLGLFSGSSRGLLKSVGLRCISVRDSGAFLEEFGEGQALQYYQVNLTEIIFQIKRVMTVSGDNYFDKIELLDTVIGH